MSTNQQRAELHKAIWGIANQLRGSVDGWDFKQYVLGFLFYRFISENITSHLNQEEKKAGNQDFNYANLSDEDATKEKSEIVKEKGFFILPSELFENVETKAKNNADLNQTLDAIVAEIENK